MYDIANLKIPVPEPAAEILQTLRQAGYEAWIVGGCVRDAILGKEPKDWDITTSALPEQVKSLFSNTVDTGIQHGTVMVIRKGQGYEVTTYRIDGEYKDGRHPEQVTFTRSLSEDLKRRDFTINAFAYNPEEGVVDLFHGIDDLENGLIRCVGSPDERFGEDALRIMRAVRFSAQLSFRIEAETCAAMERHVSNLARVSIERIRVEFEKTLISPNPEKTSLYAQLGLSRYVVPAEGLAEKCFVPAAEPLYSRLSGEMEKYLRLAAFFRELDAEECHRALRSMKYDNKTIRLVSGIIKNRTRKFAADRLQIKRALNEMGQEIFDLVLDYREGELRAEALNPENRQNSISFEELAAVRGLEKEILQEGEPFLISHLAVNGSDLIAAGIPKGERIGEILAMLLERVLEDPAWNERETLMKLAEAAVSGSADD